MYITPLQVPLPEAERSVLHEDLSWEEIQVRAGAVVLLLFRPVVSWRAQGHAVQKSCMSPAAPRPAS